MVFKPVFCHFREPKKTLFCPFPEVGRPDAGNSSAVYLVVYLLLRGLVVPKVLQSYSLTVVF